MLSLKPLIRTSPELGVFVQAACLLPAQGRMRTGTGREVHVGWTRVSTAHVKMTVCTCAFVLCLGLPVTSSSRLLLHPSKQKKQQNNTQANKERQLVETHTQVKGSDIQYKR